MKRFGLKVKRIMDIIVSALFLALLSPIFVGVAISVRLTMGTPIVFQQSRIGYQGRVFTILKFRTMKNTTDLSGSPLPDAQRLTGFGALLRKSTLDELPELINVLRGDMSIVGPRPLLVEYQNGYSPEQWRRHEMPPGMAGPVLVGGRNALAWEEKFERDVWYVDHWSLWLDFTIFIGTLLAVLRREGVSAQGHATMPRFTGSSHATRNPDETKG